MGIKTELLLFVRPILDWAPSLDWHGLGLTVLGAVIIIVLRKILARGIMSVNIKVLKMMSITFPDAARKELEIALRIVIVCVGLLLALQAANPPELLADILQKMTLSVVLIALFAAWYRLAAVFVAILDPMKPGNGITEIDWIVRVARFVIVLLGITALLGLWKVNVSAAITGVGFLGAGLAIAAQDLLRNLFAGMSNVRERRFVTGDWIHVDGVAEGHVQQIDLRSTTIIGFDRIPRYVPNADLANATVQNLSRRDHRRVSWIVPLVLSATNDQVEAVCVGLREFLETSGDFVTDNDDMLCLVQVAGLSDSAVDVKIYAFTQVNGYADYLKVCQKLTACIRQVVNQAGTSMAYPTHSLIVERSISETPEL